MVGFGGKLNDLHKYGFDILPTSSYRSHYSGTNWTISRQLIWVTDLLKAAGRWFFPFSERTGVYSLPKLGMCWFAMSGKDYSFTNCKCNPIFSLHREGPSSAYWNACLCGLSYTWERKIMAQICHSRRINLP